MWLLFIFGLCGPAVTLATEPVFRRITTEHGLAHDAVTSLLLDRHGFMWVGTEYGLSRYDGYDFVNFRHVKGDSTSLPGNRVQQLAEDIHGHMWIATASGLARFDPATDRFYHDHPPLKRIVYLTDLVADKAGYLWAGLNSLGLYRLRPDADGRITAGRHFPPEVFPGAGMNRGTIRSLLAAGDSSMWISTEQSLTRWDARQDTVIRYGTASGQEGALALANRPAGGIWVGTEHRLAQVDRDDRLQPASPLLNGAAVVSLYQDAASRLWIGTRTRGIYLLDAAGSTYRRLAHDPNRPTSIGHGTVTAFAADGSEAVWVGTYGGGLSVHMPDQRKMAAWANQPDDPTSLSSSAVFSVLEDGDGTLWVGTAAGLNRLPDGKRVDQVLRPVPGTSGGLSHNIVRALLEGDDGALWVGTDAGLNRLDRKSGHVTAVPMSDTPEGDKLDLGKIRGLHPGPDGQLWIATNDIGLVRFDPVTGRVVRLRESLTDQEWGGRCVRSLTEDAAGILWLATTRGLVRYDPTLQQTRIHLHDPDDPASLSSNSVYAVQSTADGTVWVCSAGGLSRLDEGSDRFVNYTVRDGLPSRNLYDLAMDARGDLWISSDRGIWHVRLTADESPQLTVRRFGLADGVAGAEFNAGATYRTADGTIYMGGMAGLNAFHPDDLRQNDIQPPTVVFTSCQIQAPGSAPIDVPGIAQKDSVWLPHTATHLRIAFAALDFVDPAKNEYAYWLEGLEPDWVRLGAERHLTLSLPPGNYRLHVRAANSQGVWNRAGRSLAIKVETPYWMTWWFRIGAGLGLVGLAVTGHRLRLRRIQAKNAELDRLNRQLEAKNAELERFTYTVSHDLKTPLVTITGFLGMIEQDIAGGEYDRLPQDAGHIRRAVDTMKNLLNDLLELSRIGRIAEPNQTVDLGELAHQATGLVSGRLNQAKVSIADDLPTVVGDPRRLLEVFQNLLDNAAKFCGDQPAPHIEVGVRRGDETVIFVRDNGIGIDPCYHDKVFGLFERLHTDIEGTGIGLALVKRIVEVHGGRIWVESAGQGSGSTFCFTLPPRA